MCHDYVRKGQTREINKLGKNKNMAKTRMNVGGIIAIMFVATILIAGSVFLFGFYLPSQNALNPSNPSNPSSIGCSIAPNINQIAINSLVLGTTPAIANDNFSIYNGSYVGAIPTSPSFGESLDVVATAANYLNARATISSLKCDGNDLKFIFTPFANVSLVAKSADSVTLNTATQNETASANQIIDTVKLSGTPLKSTGDMLVVVAYSNKTEVSSSDISMAGGSRVDTPDWYSTVTGSSVGAFTVPAIVNGGSKSYDVTLTPQSGKTIGAGNSLVTITVYMLQPVIVDTNTGTFQTTNTWQDSLGVSTVINAGISTSYYIK